MSEKFSAIADISIWLVILLFRCPSFRPMCSRYDGHIKKKIGSDFKKKTLPVVKLFTTTYSYFEKVRLTEN